MEKNDIMKDVEDLVSFAEEENIYELELREGDSRIKFKRFKRRPSKLKEERDIKTTSGYEDIVSPLTGTFYSSPSSTASPFVEIGSKVIEGQVIGLIEAMKLFNEIKADRSGTIREIFVKDGQLVKAGDVIMRLERD